MTIPIGASASGAGSRTRSLRSRRRRRGSRTPAPFLLDASPEEHRMSREERRISRVASSAVSIERRWREVRRDVLDDAERRYLVALLEATRGRIGDAARRAGMAPRSLHEKMRKHGLRKEAYRG